jgi:hypothetical protein
MCKRNSAPSKASTKRSTQNKQPTRLERFRDSLAGLLGLRDDIIHRESLRTGESFQTADRPPSSEELPNSNDVIPTRRKRIDAEAHWVEIIQSKGNDIGKKTGGSIGFALGAIVLLPFGPISMCVCAVGGLCLGILFGLIYDFQRARLNESLAERELKRLTYLVRFASNQINKRLFIHSSASDVDYCLDLLETVIVEFRPFVEVAHLSPSVLKKLRLLHSFLSQNIVMQCLWMYVNGFLARWANSLTVMEFIETCQNVLQTLVDVELKLGLNEPDDRLEVIVKVEEFLKQPLIRLFLDSQSRGVDISAVGNLQALLVRDLRKHIVKSGIRLPSLDIKRKVTSVHSGAISESDVDELEAQGYMDSMEIPETVTPTAYQSPQHIGRPFFRSFKDFMEFDLELKHRIPITVHEARFLYEKEAEPHNNPGWETTVSRPNIKVLRYIHSNEANHTGPNPPVLVRAYASIPKVTMANVFYHIVDTDLRPKWDQNFAKFSLVPHPHEEECEILYCTINAPFGVTPRDFLQYRKSIVEGSVVTIMMRSAIHDEKPPVHGYIRAESLISGYVIRQKGEDCELFLMSQTDIKGLIPKWMVNIAAAKAPAQWIDNLIRSCTRLKDTEFNGDQEKMNTFFESFMQKRLAQPISVERFSSAGSGLANNV